MPLPTLTCVRWYERVGPDFITAVDRWLLSAKQYPAAVPVRFGDTEPLTHDFTVEGADGLRTAEQTSRGVLFVKLQNPRSQLSLATPVSSAEIGDYGAHTLIADIPPDEPQLREFAIAFASQRTVFLSISVNRRPDIGDAGVREPYLAPHGRWLGLPPERPEWSWFGLDYTRDLTRHHVPLNTVDGGAVLSGQDWVPSQFRAHPEQSVQRNRTAQRIPPALR